MRRAGLRCQRQPLLPPHGSLVVRPAGVTPKGSVNKGGPGLLKRRASFLPSTPTLVTRARLLRSIRECETMSLKICRYGLLLVTMSLLWQGTLWAQEKAAENPKTEEKPAAAAAAAPAAAPAVE